MQDKMKSYLDEKENMVDEASDVLDKLIPTPDTIWGNISKDKLKAADGDTMREICSLSYDDDTLLQRVLGRASRRMDIVLFVRAVVLKTEANKIDGYLGSEFEAAGINIASNTDENSAINAAIFRLLTEKDGFRSIDKFRVSRAAKAMKGIEIICQDEGIPINFASAGEILRKVIDNSRSELCNVAKQKTKPASASTPARPTQDADPAPDDPEPRSQPDVDANPEPAGETNTVTGISGRQKIAPPPIVPDLPAERVFLDSLDLEAVDALPEADLHLIAAVRVGQNLVVKGVVCSGEKARALVHKAIAG